MSNENITIEVTDKYSDDVITGLKLFADVSNITLEDELLKEWCYWLFNNPFGKSIYVIARDNEKVIGFNALIPIEMYINGKVVNGAKAEFLGVASEYRDKIALGDTIQLPFSIVAKLYGSARKFGIEVLFSVPNKAAAACNLMGGARLIKFRCRHFFTYFRKPELSNYNKYKKFLLTYGVLTASLLKRKYKMMLPGDKKRENDISFGLDVIRKSITSIKDSRNRFLFFSEKMLNFRFPEENFVCWSTGKQDDKKYLIFNKPRNNNKIFLLHWNSLGLLLNTYKRIFKELYKICSKEGTNSIHVLIPIEQKDSFNIFKQIGFNYKDEIKDVYIYNSDKQMKISRNPKDWDLTDSYRNFI